MSLLLVARIYEFNSFVAVIFKHKLNNMNKRFLFFIIIFFSLFYSKITLGALCNANLSVNINLDENWEEREKLRLEKEEFLLEKYKKYITKKSKALVAEAFNCEKGEDCDFLQNCQVEKNIKNILEIEYSMKIDSGIIIVKSHCNILGKCIGYNDFFHTKNVTIAEDRLIDIKHDNAIFHHYFYSKHSNSYEHPFNITNFHTGSELYLNNFPYFSPNEKIMIEEKGKNEIKKGVNIYEANEFGEYKKVEPLRFDSRNLICKQDLYFHSWKNNKEVRFLTSEKINSKSIKVIVFYDARLDQWSCRDNLSADEEIEFYPPIDSNFKINFV